MYVTDQGHGKSPDLPRPPAPRGRPTPPEPAAKCPRCASTNTKFCYYNNYNKSQPRHFCKSCKRHWTKGGTLRNVPVGGARSKNKRSRINIPKPIAGNINHDQQKRASSILYRALIGGPPKTDDGVTNTTTTDDHHFQFSSLCAFEITSPPDLNPVEYRYNLDSVEESINNNNDNKDNNTTISNIPGASNGSWPGPDTGSCFELLPNYWNWSEIEVLASSDEHDLNISWDEIKP